MLKQFFATAIAAIFGAKPVEPPKSVESVMSAFSKTIDDLNEMEAAARAAAEYHQTMIRNHASSLEAQLDEANRAGVVAGRLFALISGQSESAFAEPKVSTLKAAAGGN